MAEPVLEIRKASAGDLPVLSRFGLALARLHATFDEERFVVPSEGEARFQRFFAAELAREEAMLLIAELEGTPVGYAFVRLEEASLEDLRGPGAFLHDIYVTPAVGTRGVGRRLVEAAFDAARSLGSTSLSLGVSPRNARARALFDRMGFRAAMVEMRAELGESADRVAPSASPLPGGGAMKTTASARFAIKTWNEKPWNEGQDPPKLTRASVARSYSGDLEGEGQVEYLMMYRPDGSAAFVGLERIAGRLAGRAGSFVLQRTGVFESGLAKETYLVVPGSATGELRSLRGEGASELGHASEYPMTLEYELD